ncbi:putative reverse transcriptase domain-containing protein [Tanacetum coccineum]
MSSSSVTYTSVYTDFEPGRVVWGADEEPSDGGPPRVIVYGYDGILMQPVAPPSPDYVPGPKHPPSPDYVSGPEHPPSPVYLPYVPEPEYPEYLVPSDAGAPLEDQSLPADASPIAISPGYVLDSDPEEDSEADHADGGDSDDEPSDDDDDDDDTDDEDEEPFEDEGDDEEEEEHLALVDSFDIPITRLRRAQKTIRLEPTMSASMEARIAEHVVAPTPPLPVASPPLPLPSPLTTSPTDAGAPLGYRAAGIRMRAASPPMLLSSTSHRTDIPEAEIPPRKRACLTTPAFGLEIGESSAAGAARQPGTTLEADLRRDRVIETGYGITDTWDEIVEAMLEENEEFQVRLEDAQDDRAYLRARVNTLFRDRPYHRHTAMILDREAMYARIAWTSSKDRSAAIEDHVRILEAQSPKMGQLRLTAAVSHVSFVAILYSLLSFMGKCHQKKRTTRASPATTTTPTSTLVTNAQLRELIERGVVAVLAERNADRSRNGDDSHDSGTGGRRQVSNVRECTYTDFLKCEPMNFKVIKGVVGLTQWLEKMKSVFYISNCTIACQVKFATCTLQGNALTWWNFHVRAVRHDTAYAMPWKTLKKMITDKYCPSNEIKKLETGMWNLKVKGTDVMSYNQRFQELVLMCDIMFLEESDVVENYVGGLPDMIHVSVKASKPKTMQEEIEFSTEMMDKKILTIAERQAENKRKFDDTPRNNQNQQQPFKRNNVARAYTVGPGEKKPYRVKPLCPKCNYHHDGQCAPKCTNCKRTGHSARNYRNRHVATNNNQRAQGTNQRVLTFYECGAHGHFRSDCPKLKNENQGNRAGNGNIVARAYAVGTARTNPNSNVVTVLGLISSQLH